MKTTAVLALLLVGLAASASAQNCTKAADFIDDQGYIIAPIIVPALKTLSKNWTGIVFLPSNTAVNKLKATLLNGTDLEDFPKGYTWADVFETEGLSDVLLYHLVPNEELDPSKETSTKTLGPFKTALAADKNGTFCTDADGELSVRVNVSTTAAKNYTVYVLDAVQPPAKVTSNQTACEGPIMLLDRVLLPCATSKSLTTVVADIKKAAAAATNTTTKTNTTSSPSTRGLSPTPSPSPAPSSATAAAQSVVALLACSLALLSVFLGF